MNTNWYRLKRKLNDKKSSTNPHKRRRISPSTTSPTTTNSKKSKSSNPKNTSKTTPTNKPFITRYLNPSSNPLTPIANASQSYRNNTSHQQLFSTINLTPPTSTNNNIERRTAFWNDLRLKLRARLPKEFLFKLITPISDSNNPKKSNKLHEIAPDTKHTNVMALDCEMVGIGNNNKSILARISIVNWYGNVVYDQFIQPINDPNCVKITDFREYVTGITRQDLVEYGITFEQCRKDIIKLLKGKKLVGHAIDNDFAVIKCANILKKNFYSNIGMNANGNDELSKRKQRKILHRKGNESWFFDTAKCELLHENLNRPRGLKFLLELFLGIHIQSDSHDSVIDAISTMAIYRAVLPEIKEKSKKRVIERREKEKKKKKKLIKKEERIERREEAWKNQKVMRNYAYDNELDRLMAQFGNDSGS